jgi:uncharacterized protein YfiM (DUF2279 family)
MTVLAVLSTVLVVAGTPLAPVPSEHARPHAVALAASDSVSGLAGLPTAPDSISPDRWLAWDKLWHFSASFVTVGASYHVGTDRFGWNHAPATGAALGGTFCIGLTKELSDLLGPKRHFSWKDLVADAAGIAAGYFVFVHRYE